MLSLATSRVLSFRSPGKRCDRDYVWRERSRDCGNPGGHPLIIRFFPGIICQDWPCLAARNPHPRHPGSVLESHKNSPGPCAILPRAIVFKSPPAKNSVKRLYRAFKPPNCRYFVNTTSIGLNSLAIFIDFHPPSCYYYSGVNFS
jgi:hypothetical protein